jgi:hypothetical protein
VLVVETGDDEAACGCWRREMPTLRKGRRYVLEAGFMAEGVGSLGHSV